jgi:hypothetical protein
MSAAPPPPLLLLIMQHRQRLQLLLRRGAPALAEHRRLVVWCIETFVSLQQAESRISKRRQAAQKSTRSGKSSRSEAGRTGGGGLEPQNAAPAPLLQ